MSVCVSVCLCVCVSVCLSVFLSVCMYVCLFVHACSYNSNGSLLFCICIFSTRTSLTCRTTPVTSSDNNATLIVTVDGFRAQRSFRYTPNTTIAVTQPHRTRSISV